MAVVTIIGLKMLIGGHADGGMKQSGFGKDMSDYSCDKYTQNKHVMIKLTSVAEKGWHNQISGEPAD